jgi:hypothetical protein
MRTITTTAYQLSELSEEAKQTAIREYRGEGVDTSHNWNEARESVKEFCDLFNVSDGRNSWLDIICSSFGEASNRNELTGQRLRTYLLNNFPSAFYERKYHKSHHSEEKPAPHRMRSIKPWSKGGYWVTLRSNFETESCCPFTGVCYDEYLLQPLKDFVKKPDNRNFEDLMTEAGESLCKSLESGDEYQNSDEAIIERMEANDYEFTEDGNRI